MFERDQRLRLGVVGGAAAVGQVVRDKRQPAHDAVGAGMVERGRDVDDIALGEPQPRQLRRADEQHVAPPDDAAIAVVERVDGGVVLIVGAQRRQPEDPRDVRAVLGETIGDHEVGLGGRRLPDALLRAVGELEPAGFADAVVIALEAGDHRLDFVADQRIVADQRVPVDIALAAQHRLRDAGDDRRLGPDIVRRRRKEPRRGVDHRHRILDRHRLPPGRLHVELGPPEARQDVAVPPDEQVRAVELGGDVDRQLELPEAGETRLRIGRRDREIAAEADDCLRAAVAHRRDRLDHRMAFVPRRLEAEDVAHPVEELGLRPLGDADGAVALHVRMTAQRADAGPGAPDIALEQQQVGDLLDVAGTGRMLGDAHAVADDRRRRGRVQRRDPFECGAGQPARGLDRRPVERRQVRGIGFEPVRVPRDERVVEHRRAVFGACGRVERDHRLRDALQRRRVAADLDLQVGRGDRRRAAGRHLDRRLRRFEPFERALAQRIEDHARHTALRRVAQRGHHPRVVGAGVVAHRQDQRGGIEILERHRRLADADRFRQPDRGRLVAHVRTVGEIVGPVQPREQLVEKRRLVRAAARGVELRRVRGRQRVEAGCDPVERFLPADGREAVGRGVVAERRRDPALRLEPVIGLLPQLGDRVRGEELRADVLGGRLPRHRLRAVLAEFERRGVLRVGPRAARAVEAVGLVRLEQGLGTLHDHLLFAERRRDGLQRPPAAGGGVVIGDAFGTALLHGRVFQCKLLFSSRAGSVTP